MYSRVLRHCVKRPACSNLRSWCRKYHDSTPREDGDSHIPQGGKYYTWRPERVSDPLRILFCGSDEFSSTSLRALFDLHEREPDLIASIDVLCRLGKRSGRSLKEIREVPIKAVAQELGLPVHERDTFTGWELPSPYPEPINLIIAVSFGLFVPPRILRSVDYGGLNIHPSILPNFRGPAPLQHIILTDKKKTGVTLQTLDETSFDTGVILAQTPANGLPLPGGDKCTYPDLLEFLKPIAASMLVRGLQDRVFVPPYRDVGWSMIKSENMIHAKKITSTDKKATWRSETAKQLERRFRALGRLWSFCYQDKDASKRVVFEDMEIVPNSEAVAGLLRRFRKRQKGPLTPTHEEEESTKFAVIDLHGSRKPLFYAVEGDAVIFTSQGNDHGIRVKEITVEGKGKQTAAMAMKSFNDSWQNWSIRVIKRRMHCFHKDEKLPILVLEQEVPRRWNRENSKVVQ